MDLIEPVKEMKKLLVCQWPICGTSLSGIDAWIHSAYRLKTEINWLTRLITASDPEENLALAKMTSIQRMSKSNLRSNSTPPYL